MRTFIIDEKQLQSLATTLLEFPAKFVLNSLNMINNLPEVKPSDGEINDKQQCDQQ